MITRWPAATPQSSPYNRLKNGNLLFWSCPVNTRSVKAGGKYLGQAGWENREVLGVRIDLNGLQLCAGAMELSSQRMGGSRGGGLRGWRKCVGDNPQVPESVIWVKEQSIVCSHLMCEAFPIFTSTHRWKLPSATGKSTICFTALVEWASALWEVFNASVPPEGQEEGRHIHEGWQKMHHCKSQLFVL